MLHLRKMAHLLCCAAAMGVAAFSVSGSEPSTILYTAANNGAEKNLVQVDREYYEQFSFQWTDAQGVEHTSRVTEPATDPNHIVALLTEVYVNPLIPGYTYDVSNDFVSAGTLADDGREPYATVPYGPCTFEPFNMAEDMVVQKPIRGATCLVVEMKDSYQNPIEQSKPLEMLHAIKQVTLLTDQLYVSEYEDRSKNPGYIFNIDMSLNKMFIISKGSIRPIANGGIPMLYNMYEEFSPNNTEAVFDAYAAMKGGHQFPVDHNCASVIQQRHDFALAPYQEDWTQYEDIPVNMRFYLPDWRFRGETRGGYEHYSFYAKDYQPYLFYNSINVQLNGVADTETYRDQNKVAVPIQFTSVYKDITHSSAPEEFYIYRVIDDVVQPVPIPASQLVILQEDTYLDEDGRMLRAASTTVTIQVLEDQEELSRDVRYIVMGRRDGSTFSWVESNIVKALVPGASQFETLVISLNGHPKSTYDISAQVNHYENKIQMIDTYHEGENKLVKAHLQIRQSDEHGNVLKNGTIFEVRRYANDDTDYDVIATMEVTKYNERGWVAADGSKGVHTYEADITYTDGKTYADRPTHWGFKSVMDMQSPANDELMPILALDSNDGVIAEFIDRFEASTKLGEQPTRYTYRIWYESVVDISAEHPGGKVGYSNDIVVPVPVRHIVAGYMPYSYEQVVADTEAESRLPLNPVGVRIRTANNPDIAGYTITNVTKDKVVCRVRRFDNGAFEMTVYDDANQADYALNPQTYAGYTGYLPIRLNSTVDVGDKLAMSVDYKNGNTYGNIYSCLTAVPEPEIVYNQMFCSRITGGTSAGYYADVDWVAGALNASPWPEMPAVEHFYDVLGYHVWSKHDKMDSYKHNFSSLPSGQAPQRVVAKDDERATEVMRNSFHFDERKATATDPITVDHVVRMYSKVPAEMLIATDDAPAGYVLSERTVGASIDSTSEIVTGIDDVLTPATEGEAIYFDMQGRRVSEPQPGGIYLRQTGSYTQKVIVR